MRAKADQLRRGRDGCPLGKAVRRGWRGHECVNAQAWLQIDLYRSHLGA